jgi:hypothetical protein
MTDSGLTEIENELRARISAAIASSPDEHHPASIVVVLIDLMAELLVKNLGSEAEYIATEVGCSLHQFVAVHRAQREDDAQPPPHVLQ